MFIKFLLLGFIVSFAQAFDARDYAGIMDSHIGKDNIEKTKANTIAEFGSLKNNVNQDFADEFIKKYKAGFSGMDYKEAKGYLETFYRPNNFLTKEEADILIDFVYSSKQASQKYGQLYLLYFFSEAVPRSSVANVLLSVSLLQEEGFKIKTKQYLTGPSDNIQKYLFGWRKFIDTYPLQYQSNVAENFKLKFDPRFFKVYEVEKAPAMALAICQSDFPEPKTCKVEFLIRGDVSLLDFLDKASQIDKKYLPHKKMLEARGIYKKEVKE